MTSSLAPIRGILLDIEGTTTPIAFVHQVLFAHARSHVKVFLKANFHSAETRADIARLREEHAGDVAAGLEPPVLIQAPPDAAIDSICDYVNWLIDRDRKSTALKAMQGKIWKQGYLDGTLRAQVFADVVPALRRWQRAGLKVAIFSSGSVLAQQLLFAHTEAGDLTEFIDNYFDTSTGPKTASESYRHIATALCLPAPEVLFISDVVAELDAANAAGMRTLLCIRPGNQSQSEPLRYQISESFNDI
jgi:enolase-phosphatase E1